MPLGKMNIQDAQKPHVNVNIMAAIGPFFFLHILQYNVRGNYVSLVFKCKGL